MREYRKKKFESWHFSPSKEPARHSYKLFLCIYTGRLRKKTEEREEDPSEAMSFFILTFIGDKTIASSAFQRMIKTMSTLVLFPLLRQLTNIRKILVVPIRLKISLER